MAPESLFPLTGALLEEAGAGSAVALIFSSVSIIHSFYLTNLQNLLPLKYNSRDIMRAFYKQDTLPMCTSVLPLPPPRENPIICYDHEQANRNPCEVQAHGSHNVILSFQAFPDCPLSCCLKYILKTPNFPSLSLRSHNPWTGKISEHTEWATCSHGIISLPIKKALCSGYMHT